MSRTNENLQQLIELIQAEAGRHLGADAAGADWQTAFSGRIRELLDRFGHADTELESRQVTILLTDIRGFTALGEKYAPLAIVEMLNRYFACMCELVASYEGTVDKFMGDSIMVLFGAPESRPDDLERAIGCAVEMQLAMEEINEENRAKGLPDIFMGIGINTGVVVAGPLGSNLHSEYTVIGDEVNVTSRIEAHSMRGQVLISENTYRLARDFVTVGSPNLVRVKGKSKPVTLYELRSISRPAEMTVPPREVRSSPRVTVNMPLEFRRVDDGRVGENLHHGEVLDISYSGMMIKVPDPLEAGSEIEVTLYLGLMDSRTSLARATILRCEPAEGDYLCHIQLTELDIPGQRAIKDFVDRLVFPG
ncbi:MAG: adenylate/guanylate cyclase domain-containing protein [Xanthomonadales bacterium]|nr:adenylate/guanylate cyclase domain-containing protein [Xanthomonadales bacterium]